MLDLTLPAPETNRGWPTTRLEEWPIQSGDHACTGMVYRFDHDSMISTYIDIPGHIKETANGLDASNCPLDRIFRVTAEVVHLDRESGSGGIEAVELGEACHESPLGTALVVNALGRRRFDEIEERSVWFTRSAIQWTIARRIQLLISDVYESYTEPQGVFYDLFKAGVITVCNPVNLDRLPKSIRITALPLRFPGVTQLPCRLLAEWKD
ncbi:cyclase family protein [bacterium]|nr:cyclase family protein [bacterium]